MVSWPPTLPQHLLVQGFGQSLPEGRVRSANDVGPPKVRRRSSQNVYIITGQMVMTFDQWADLQTFVNSTTGGGTLPFLFRDPLSKIEPKLEIDFTAGTALIQGMPLLVRFGETLPAISEALGSDLVRVTMDLEVLPGPTGDFNGDVTDILQVTRASKATYFDADGVLQTADNNEPRFDHDPVTGEPLGLLIERGATNLLRWSEDLTNAVWSKSRATITDEGEGIFKLIETTDDGYHYISQPHSYSGEMSWSLEVKAVGERDVMIQRRHATGFQNATISLTTGQVLAGSWPSGGINSYHLADGWWRIEAIADTGSPPSGTNFEIYSAKGTTLQFPGDPSCGLLLRRIQHEPGPVATSYIKTEGSQVTRAADNISIPLSAFPWNEAEMTAIVEFQTFGLLNIPATQRILSRQSGAHFLYQITENARLAAYDGTNFLNLGTISTGQVVKAASSFGPRGLRGCVNGGSVVSTGYDGTFGTSPNLYLGSLNGSNGHYLHCRKLKLFPRQLSDAEMMALTA
jgi:hypothetical protein